MTAARARWVLLALAIGLVGPGCAGRQNPRMPFINGKVPDYEATYRALSEPPEESRRAFVARVRRLAAAGAPSRPRPESIESLNPALKDSLARLTLGPTPENHVRVAIEYRFLGIVDQAFDHLDAALRMKRAFAPALDVSARLWRDGGFLREALVLAHRAVYAAPRSAPARNTLGTVLQALGQRDEAHRAYGAAMALDPAAGWARDNYCATLDADDDAACEVTRPRAAVPFTPWPVEPEVLVP